MKINRAAEHYVGDILRLLKVERSSESEQLVLSVIHQAMHTAADRVVDLAHSYRVGAERDCRSVDVLLVLDGFMHQAAGDYGTPRADIEQKIESLKANPDGPQVVEATSLSGSRPAPSDGSVTLSNTEARALSFLLARAIREDSEASDGDRMEARKMLAKLGGEEQ